MPQSIDCLRDGCPALQDRNKEEKVAPQPAILTFRLKEVGAGKRKENPDNGLTCGRRQEKISGKGEADCTPRKDLDADMLEKMLTKCTV